MFQTWRKLWSPSPFLSRSGGVNRNAAPRRAVCAGVGRAGSHCSARYFVFQVLLPSFLYVRARSGVGWIRGQLACRTRILPGVFRVRKREAVGSAGALAPVVDLPRAAVGAARGAGTGRSRTCMRFTSTQQRVSRSSAKLESCRAREWIPWQAPSPRHPATVSRLLATISLAAAVCC
jgi:hypothetical protein